MHGTTNSVSVFWYHSRVSLVIQSSSTWLTGTNPATSQTFSLASYTIGQGYLYIYGATSNALCAAAAAAVITPTYTFTQVLTVSGTYGLCQQTVGSTTASR